MHEGRPGVDTVVQMFRKYLNREATVEDQERVYAEKVKLMSKAPKAEKMPKMEELINALKDREVWW